MKIVIKDKNNKEVNLYGPLESIRLLECKVFVDDSLMYEGNIDDLPKDMKNYKYHKSCQDGKVTEFFISSEYNNLN